MTEKETSGRVRISFERCFPCSARNVLRSTRTELKAKTETGGHGTVIIWRKVQSAWNQGSFSAGKLYMNQALKKSHNNNLTKAALSWERPVFPIKRRWRG